MYRRQFIVLINRMDMLMVICELRIRLRLAMPLEPAEH